MDDREIVAAIVEGDPDGLAAAYDHYALALHAYCRSLLSEPADAADAVQDTFIIAAAKLDGLRAPDRLRPWLYAVARNECRRRLRAGARSAPLDEADEVPDDGADFGEAAEHAEVRHLVWAALGGLNPGEREIIELNLRHELEGAELAEALGVPRNQAHALASRARTQFETSLGALLVARFGEEYCADLAAILDGWDGQLTVLLRKRVNRHIDRCAVCGECKRRELNPVALLSMLPVLALPAGLRYQILRLVADTWPDASDYRAHVADRAEPFDTFGFPVPVDPPTAARLPGNYLLAAGAAVAAVAILGGGAVFAADLLHHGGPAGAAAAVVTHGTPTGSAQPSPQPSASASASAAKPHRRSRPSSTPSGPASSAPGRTPSPSSTPTPRRSSSKSPSASPSPAQGTLTVSSTAVTLMTPANGGQPTGSFTVTATGGPVTFSITNPDSANLSVSPLSGPLTAGQQVTVTDTTGASITVTLTVNPGGIPVTVSYLPPLT